MKSIIILSTFLVIFSNARSQVPEENKVISVAIDSFNKYINYHLFTLHEKKYDTLNIRSCTFLSFIITKEGNIDSVACNYGTPPIMRSLFKDAIIAALKNKSAYYNGKPVRYILPIIYLFQGSAKKELVDNVQSSLGAMLDFTDEHNESLSPIFFNNNATMINCVLLKPTGFFGPAH